MEKVHVKKSVCLIIILLFIFKINSQSLYTSTAMENYFIILNKQLEAGNNEEYGSFDDYNLEDLDALVFFEQEVLHKHGYNTPDRTIFNTKIKEYFGRIIDNNSNTAYLKIDPDVSFVCDKMLKFFPYSTSAQFIYVVKKNHFITNFYPLPSFIDYKKLYKDKSLIEDSTNIIIYDEIENTEIITTKWKDVPNLEKQRAKNINTLIHRNKYLFNDNKASLTWLKLNDTDFLESLVKTFGYVDDKDLLQWVINRTFSDKNNKGEYYNLLFFMKTCSDKFVLHKATFDLLKDQINNTSLEALEKYINYRDENKELQNLSFEQKAQVLAHVLYIGEYFAQQEQYWSRFAFKFMGTFYEYDDQRDKYDEEFKKNNYYHLPDFEKLWADGKEYGDGIGLPM